MAVSRSSSPSKRPSDEEQLLPAYEQFPFTSSQASNTLPEETATPEQICDFLVQLLTTKRGISTEHASRIASKWTISSGKELRSFPPAMFTEIFGREDGYIVYREVKTLVYQLEIDEKKEKKEQRTTQKRLLDGESYQPIIRSNMPHETNSLLFFFVAVVLSVLAFVCEALLIWSIFHGIYSKDAGGVMLVLSFLAFFPMTCICIAVLVSFAGPDTAESKVETEMKEFFKTPGASQS
jgi:hypothetical protein